MDAPFYFYFLFTFSSISRVLSQVLKYIVEIFTSETEVYVQTRTCDSNLIQRALIFQANRVNITTYTSLRKHAYSNVLKILQSKKEGKFSDKNSDIFFHIPAQNIDCGYSWKPPRWGGSNQYTQSMFLAK